MPRPANHQGLVPAADVAFFIATTTTQMATHLTALGVNFIRYEIKYELYYRIIWNNGAGVGSLPNMTAAGHVPTGPPALPRPPTWPPVPSAMYPGPGAPAPAPPPPPPPPVPAPPAPPAPAPPAPAPPVPAPPAPAPPAPAPPGAMVTIARHPPRHWAGLPWDIFMVLFDNLDAEALWHLLEAEQDRAFGRDPPLDLIYEEFRARMRPGNTRAHETVLTWLANEATRPVDGNFMTLVRQYLHQYPNPAPRPGPNADPEDVIELFRGLPLPDGCPPLILAVMRNLPYVVRWMLADFRGHPGANPNVQFRGMTALDYAVDNIAHWRRAPIPQPGVAGPLPAQNFPTGDCEIMYMLLAAGANPYLCQRVMPVPVPLPQLYDSSSNALGILDWMHQRNLIFFPIGTWPVVLNPFNMTIREFLGEPAVQSIDKVVLSLCFIASPTLTLVSGWVW